MENQFISIIYFYFFGIIKRKKCSGHHSNQQVQFQTNHVIVFFQEPTT